MGQFDWFLIIGAKPQAVAVLNDEPIVFYIMVASLLANFMLIGSIYAIHLATMKPEQKKKKEPAKPAGPPRGGAPGKR